LLRIACELRPAFAVCDPAGPFGDRGHPSSNVAAWHYGAPVPNTPRPAYVAPATTMGTFS
jgi:hypothetical protein